MNLEGELEGDLEAEGAADIDARKWFGGGRGLKAAVLFSAVLLFFTAVLIFLIPVFFEFFVEYYLIFIAESFFDAVFSQAV